MNTLFICFGLLVLFAVSVTGLDLNKLEEDNDELRRKGKFVFNIVTFPNDVCEGDGRNGTCYTEAECSDRDGENDGSCAEGFGVCCVITLDDCGDTSSENHTRIELISVTTLESPCTYEICPCSSDICRIRFDLNTFELVGPFPGVASVAGAGLTNRGGAIGDCTRDSFFISGEPGSPVICGINSGEHIILDAQPNMCHTVNVLVGDEDQNTPRQLEIEVTQFKCNEETVGGGPPGCLQYFTTPTGVISSFNFPQMNVVDAMATHLSNQRYSVCVRRNEDVCFICYQTTINGMAGMLNMQASFGLSLSNAAIAKSVVGSDCMTDYISIPAAMSFANAKLGMAIASVSKICGRFFATASMPFMVPPMGMPNLVCSSAVPFRLGFVTDGDEVTDDNADAKTSEQVVSPAGIIGFQLMYTQMDCP